MVTEIQRSIQWCGVRGKRRTIQRAYLFYYVTG
jgi:hypothetical protein